MICMVSDVWLILGNGQYACTLHAIFYMAAVGLLSEHIRLECLSDSDGMSLLAVT